MKLISALAIALLAAGNATAQSAEEIIKKHNEAMGGDAWKKVTSMKSTASMSAGGMDIPIVMTKVAGKGARMDLDIMGQSNYTIITPQAGWAYFPVQGQTKPEPMKPEQLKGAQDQLEMEDEFMNYAAKGNKIELIGKDTAAGEPVYKMIVTRKDGGVRTVYISAKTYYTVKSVQTANVQGQDAEMSTVYGDYKKLPEGIAVPMSIVTQQGPIVVKTYEVNTVKDENIFKPGK